MFQTFESKEYVFELFIWFIEKYSLQSYEIDFDRMGLRNLKQSNESIKQKNYLEIIITIILMDDATFMRKIFHFIVKSKEMLCEILLSETHIFFLIYEIKRQQMKELLFKKTFLNLYTLNSTACIQSHCNNINRLGEHEKTFVTLQ